VGAENVWVQADAANPLGDQPRVLSRRHTPFRAAPAGEHKFARLLTGCSYVVIDCLPGLLRQFKPDWPARFLLAYRSPID
jgi:hypothetical protein